MDGKQLSIYLSGPEIKSLVDLAIRECRRPNDQAKYIIRQALGLVEPQDGRQNEIRAEQSADQ
jgi:hypothetical protein